MKLTKSTIEVLANFASINPSVMMKPGKFINTKSINNVIYAEAHLEDEIDVTAGIYSLSEFLGIYNIVGADGEVTEDGEYITVASAGRSQAKLKMAVPSTIVHPKKSINFPVADVVFEFGLSEFKQVYDAASGMGLTHLSFYNKDGKIRAGLSSETSENSYWVEVADYDGTANFEFIVSFANMKMIKGTYTVMIAKDGAVMFKGDRISYVIALDSKSKYTA